MTVERIDYQAGNVTGKGALLWNENVNGKRPLLLVMPNWLGVTETAIKRAQNCGALACHSPDPSDPAVTERLINHHAGRGMLTRGVLPPLAPASSQLTFHLNHSMKAT